MTVNITDYKRVSNLIDLLNGNSNFVIDNPYFPLKGSNAQIDNFIEFKEITKDKKVNGYRLQMPGLMFRKSQEEAFTKNFTIRPDNGGSASTKIKLFPPYDSTKSLNALNKVFTTFGELNDVLKCVIIFDYQIRQAYELLLLVRLLNLNITKCKTDDEIFELVKNSGIELKNVDKYKTKFASEQPYNITKRKSKDETDEFGDESDSESEINDLFSLIEQKSLTSKLTGGSTNNPVYKYYKSKLKPLNPLFTVSQITSKDSKSTSLSVSANLTFSLTIDDKHVGSTMRLHNKKENVMTYKEYQSIQNKKLLSILCFKFECDIRRYGTNITPVNGMRGMIKCIGYKPLSSSSKSYLEDTYDDFIDEDETNNENELIQDENF